MHVCIDYRPALHQGTGVGTYVHGLLAALLRGRSDATFTAFSASLRHRLRPPPEIDGARVVDVRFPVRVLDWLWHRRGWPAVESWVGAVDVAHSPSPMLLPARRARQVVTVHDCYFLSHPEAVWGPMRRDYVPLFRGAVEGAHAVVAVSNTTRTELLAHVDIAPEKVHVTPLGVSPRFHPPTATESSAARRRLALPARFLLFVGRREPRKGLDTLLRAFDRVAADSDVALVLAGPDGPNWATTWAAAPERVRDRTLCLPHLDADTLVGLYGAASALVLPSLWEGFGLTGLEAMATGTPVVASRAGALPEVLGDAPLWVEPGDAAALAEACLRALDDEPERGRARDAGLAQARRFSWDRTAELTLAAYRSVLGK